MGSLRLTVMKHLALEEGWAPLLWHATGSRNAPAKVKPPPTFAPADDGDWEALKVEALQALRKGHEAQLMAPPDIMLAGGDHELV